MIDQAVIAKRQVVRIRLGSLVLGHHEGDQHRNAKHVPGVTDKTCRKLFGKSLTAVVRRDGT